MKTLYIAAGAVAVFLMWRKGQQAKTSDLQLQDTIASQQGSDWIGSGGLFAMWDRLSGSDLKLDAYPNASGEVSADFSKVARRNASLMPGWNGSLA